MDHNILQNALDRFERRNKDGLHHIEEHLKKVRVMIKEQKAMNELIEKNVDLLTEEVRDLEAVTEL